MVQKDVQNRATETNFEVCHRQ